jgi:hypothetical protein
MPEENGTSPDIDNISVVKLDDDRFRILLGAKTEIPNLYSASTGIEIDRTLLEQFIESAKEALGK